MSKENSKNQILKAAMKIFVVNGYSNTKMDDIADEAGFSKGAVYHHFSSKHDLFFSLIDYWETSFLPKFYSNDYSNVSLVNVLKELASEVASNFKNKKYLFLAELEIWALSNRDVKVRERTKKLYNKMLSHLENIFSNAINDGEYKNIDPGMAAMAVMTSMQGVIWFSIFDHKNFTAEQYVNEVMNFIINGLKKTSIEMTN
ncbi:MAG: hypothetical protein CMG07_04700 [Candidatus Marinimicrobia bacterium]|nr:hypothetical protein [Candidatus Neomarinimicrobiota bacterium]